jgi:hypothetical protein
MASVPSTHTSTVAVSRFSRVFPSFSEKERVRISRNGGKIQRFAARPE